MDPALLAAIIANPDDDGVRLVCADWLEEHGEAERAEFIRAQVALAALPAVEGCIVDFRPPAAAALAMGSPFRALVPRGLALPRACTLRHQNRDDSWHEAEGVQPWRVEEYDGARALVTFGDCPLKRRERELLDSDAEVGWRGPANEANGLIWRRGFVDALRIKAHTWLRHADAILAAQPVREVTLTTWPKTEVTCQYRDEGHFRLAGTRAERWYPFDSAPQILAAEWPRLHFTLPDPAPAV